VTTSTKAEAPASRTTAGALGPSPYGLTRHETRNEMRRLAAAGWQLWELRQRLVRGTTPQESAK
jgi:hypothetical protein